MRKCFILFLSLFHILVLTCTGKGQSLDPYLFSGTSRISNPTFSFEYGNATQKVIVPARFLKPEDGGVCLFSLPENLYHLESGARFKLCLPTGPTEEQALLTGFALLDEEREASTLFYIKHELWEAKETTFGKWEKEKKDLLPLESFVENQTSDGTISFTRFDVPSAQFFQWDADSCEVTFPSRLIHVTRSSWKMISIEFRCERVEIKERIVSQNEKWLRECTQRNPSLTEVFRHSDSPFGRFLEWGNETEEVLCPMYESLYFQEEANSNLTSLDQVSLSKLADKHKLILPHSAFLLSASEQLNGMKVPESFLLNIGKKGSWNLGTSRFSETTYAFKQGEEFFSRSSSRPSCRNQLKYNVSNAPSCLNPGLPNSLTSETDNNPNAIPSCRVQDLSLTEFFSGTELPASLPSFLELRNDGPACDLSNLVLNYEYEEFILSALEKSIRPGELSVLSREKWEGWNFSSIVKPFSTKSFKFKIPYLSLRSLETREEQFYLQDPKDYVLTNWNGQVNRSILLDRQGGHLPHPNLGSLEIFSSSGIFISPGSFSEVTQIPFLKLPLSEILISGTKDANGSYPERFLEWEDAQNQEGFVKFQIESQKQERFVFFKEKKIPYPLIKSGIGVCLPNTGMILPDGSLPNESLTISLLDVLGIPQVSSPSFRYESSIYETLGLNASSRISIHPEKSPFIYSYTRPNSFGYACSPFSEATPGRANQKRNMIEATFTLNATGIPDATSFSFLETPSQSSIFSLVSMNKIHRVITSVSQQILDLWNESIPSIFANEELIYLQWQEDSFSINEFHVFRLGEARMEAVYPSPLNSQNEWIYFCNVSQQAISTASYVIEDEASSDPLVPYSTRFPSKNPSFSSQTSLKWNESTLGIGDCAFIVDPDGSNWNLPLFAKNSDILLTVASTQTIGNAISNTENLNLYKDNGSERLLISTYGKKNTPSNFQIPLKNLEYSLLKKDSLGNSVRDFQIFKENP